MGRKKQIDTSMYFVPIPTAPITVKWGLATRLWVPAITAKRTPNS